ncbi:hypothetical protein KAH81_05475 [bacterium]|nr:hypothetical protein [bacterium]
MRNRVWILAFMVVAGLFLLGSNCEYGLAPRYTAVEGDLIFNGEWPEQAIMCFIVIVDEKPDELVLDPNLLKGFYQIPESDVSARTDSVHFEIELNQGSYNWTFVAILDSAALNDPENGLGWRNLATEYIDEEDPNKLGSLEIGESSKPKIRMLVDFTTPYQGIGNPGYFHLESR